MNQRVFDDYWTLEIVLIFFKYFLIAGALYLVFYQFYRKRFILKKLQPAFPQRKQILSEIKYSMSTLIIYAAFGVAVLYAKHYGITRIYDNWRQYGVIYFFLSLPIMILINDAWFYWTHRLLHVPFLYRLAHRVHHQFENPTPWAAFAFHPLEALLQAGILPLIVFTIPCHPIMIFLFILHLFVINILGHLGYETYPKWFLKSRFFRWVNTSTNHNYHHQKFHGNYGFYYTFWDRLMNTFYDE
jgi:sterol desaturase/sphingolipid hydroxylase (fatty acid hydroxylase superfamily)